MQKSLIWFHLESPSDSKRLGLETDPMNQRVPEEHERNFWDAMVSLHGSTKSLLLFKGHLREHSCGSWDWATGATCTVGCVHTHTHAHIFSWERAHTGIHKPIYSAHAHLHTRSTPNTVDTCTHIYVHTHAHTSQSALVCILSLKLHSTPPHKCKPEYFTNTPNNKRPSSPDTNSFWWLYPCNLFNLSAHIFPTANRWRQFFSYI